jgi:hypothetical protein
LIETNQFSTISKVMYDTTAGNDMIIYHIATTSMHNKRIQGGEIVLKSWLGFTKHIHVNWLTWLSKGGIQMAEGDNDSKSHIS